ncbi:T9SS type A sorting domain-containing protein [Bacteroidota bacterium]
MFDPNWVAGGAGILIFSGPFNFAPNDTQWVMAALVPALGKDKYDSIVKLREQASYLRSLSYDEIVTKTVITDITKEQNIPIKYELHQNYPNPFNPSTKITYSIPSTISPLLGEPIPRLLREDERGGLTPVRLVVYDILGREIAVLVNKEQLPGTYEVEFRSDGLSSGVYLFRLITDKYEQTRKMILLH